MYSVLRTWGHGCYIFQYFTQPEFNITCMSVKTSLLSHNENAWAFTYLPCFPNCTVLLPKSPFLCYGSRDTHKFIMWRHMRRHDVIPWSHTIGHNEFTLKFPSGKSLEITFSGLVTLTFDLRPWATIPAYLRSRSTLISINKIKVKVNSHNKNQGHRSNGSAVRVLTHRHTAPILWPRPLTREVTMLCRGGTWCHDKMNRTAHCKCQKSYYQAHNHDLWFRRVMGTII